MPSLAFVVTFEKPSAVVPAPVKGASGKALARESERLEFAARRCSVASLTSFLSENQSALIEKMKAEGFDPSKMRVPPEQWFTPAEGLKVVRALLPHVEANLNDYRQPNPILRDLRGIEAELIAAEKAGVRFHLSRAEV